MNYFLCCRYNSDADFEMEGFDQPWRLDCDTHLTGKLQGGGVNRICK